MASPLKLDKYSSRYCGATFGFVDACVRAVAAGAEFERVIPGYSAQDVALVARDVLESHLLIGALEENDLNRGVQAGDWTLAVLAERRFAQAAEHEKAGRAAEREATEAAAYAALDAIAASADRSPLLWYEDIYFETAQHLACRGDRLALTRQAQCIMEGLRQGNEENGAAALRDFAFHCLELGENRRGFGLLSAILTNEPADIWTYNTIAARLGKFGYGAAARQAAERGLQLLAETGDPDELKSQLHDHVVEYKAVTDRDDAAQVLREAMSVDFATGQHLAIADLSRQLIAEVELVQVKELPSMPDQTELNRIAAGLKSAFGDEIAKYQSWGQRLQRLIGRGAASTSPKPPVGRNEPCPCGSGKKFKKCCGSPTKS